jgi:hypothetical protein
LLERVENEWNLEDWKMARICGRRIEFEIEEVRVKMN